MTVGRQLALDLTRHPSYTADAFLTSASNSRAFAMIDSWPRWPERILLMVGPPGSGKSHLGAIWAQRAGAQIVRPGSRLEPDAMLGPETARAQSILLEDGDRAGYSEAALFHLMNLIRERQGWLLVSARTHPDIWGLETPDVLSRLRLAPSVAFEAPDSALIRDVMLKLFSDRQIRIDPGVVDYAALHSEQSLDAISRFVATVDEDALAEGRRITRPLAARTLARLNEDDRPPFTSTD